MTALGIASTHLFKRLTLSSVSFVGRILWGLVSRLHELCML